jgi:hypothetical protein
MYILGLRAFGPGSAAALLHRGPGGTEAYFVAEESLPSATDRWPLGAVVQCLDHFGLDSIRDVDLLCVDAGSERWPDEDSQFGRAAARADPLSRTAEAYRIERSLDVTPSRIHRVNHIDALAAMLLDDSRPGDSSCVVIGDGVGAYSTSSNSWACQFRAGFAGPIIQRSETKVPEGPSAVGPGRLIAAVADRLACEINDLPALADHDGENSAWCLDLPSTAVDRRTEFLNGYSVTRSRLLRTTDVPAGALAREALALLHADALALARTARRQTNAVQLCVGGRLAGILDLDWLALAAGYEAVQANPIEETEGALGAALFGIRTFGKTVVSSSTAVVQDVSRGRTRDRTPGLSRVCNANLLKTVDQTLEPEVTRRVTPPISSSDARLTNALETTLQRSSPFPHTFVENVFSDSFYAEILQRIPHLDYYVRLRDTARVRGEYPPERFVFFLAHDAMLDSLPEGEATFWRTLRDWLTGPDWIAKVDNFLGNNIPPASDEKLVVEVQLIKDFSGYRFPPHTDIPAERAAAIFYLPTDERWAAHGTSLYVPNDSLVRCEGLVHHERSRFIRASTLPYRPNSLLVIPKSTSSFHGVEAIKETGIVRDLLLWQLFCLTEAQHREYLAKITTPVGPRMRVPHTPGTTRETPAS